MKTPMSRLRLAPFGWLASGSVALAHPGHDDGHELIWDLNHLSSHPVATVLWVAVAILAAGVIWQAVRRRSRTQRLPVSRD